MPFPFSHFLTSWWACWGFENDYILKGSCQGSFWEMYNSNPCNPDNISSVSLINTISTGQCRKLQCLNGMEGKKSQSFNLFPVDHYHYLQSVLYIIRGFIFAIQKLSLIMCYLQIAAHLHASLWWNESLALHCINITSMLFFSYSKSSDLVTGRVQNVF